MNLKTISIGPYSFTADSESRPGRDILENGLNYEKHVVAELRRFAPSSVGFLDVGANCGIHTVIARTFNDKLPIVAVECSPFNVPILIQNITQNKLEGVTVLPVALSDKSGPLLANNCQENTSCTAQAPSAEMLAGYPRYLPALALDFLNLPPIDLVKIDIEGMELVALRGASRLMATRPRIIFEFCPILTDRSGVTPAAFLDWFFNQGYTLTTLDYVPGMRATFKESGPLLAHIAATSGWIADILAEP